MDDAAIFAEATSLATELLPPNATPLERIMVAVGARLLRTEVPIEEIIDPLRCPEEFLPWLAWARSIDIWESSWPTSKKRSVISRWYDLHRLKGTEEGIRQHLEIVDATLLQVVKPPEKMFLAGPVPKAEVDAYLARLPEIRVFIASETAPHDGGLYLDAGYLDADYLAPERGTAIYGRRARLWRDGVETPLSTFTTVTTSETRGAIDFEKVVIPGDAGAALFLDDGYLDADYWESTLRTSGVITYQLDRTYIHSESSFPVTTVTPGLEPVTPRFDRASLDGHAGAALMLDADYLDDGYLVPDNAGLLIFDRLRLFDPEIEAPHGLGGDFLDDARLGMAPFTAELMIQADRRGYSTELHLDDGYLDDGFLVNDDLSLTEKAMDAAVIAKSFRDKILVTFETTRPLTLGDGFKLDGSVTLSSRTRRYL